jgi:hypothetical protein
MAGKRNIGARELLEKVFDALTRDSKDILFLPHKVVVEVENDEGHGASSAEINSGYYTDAVVMKIGAVTWLLSLGHKCNNRNCSSFGCDIVAIRFEEKMAEPKLGTTRRAMEALSRNNYLVNSVIYTTLDGNLTTSVDSPFYAVMYHLLSLPETKAFVAKEAEYSNKQFMGYNRPLLLSETKYLPAAVKYFVDRIRDILALA